MINVYKFNMISLHIHGLLIAIFQTDNLVLHSLISRSVLKQNKVHVKIISDVVIRRENKNTKCRQVLI